MSNTPLTDKKCFQTSEGGIWVVHVNDAREFETSLAEKDRLLNNSNEICNTNWITSLAEAGIKFDPTTGKFRDTNLAKLQAVARDLANNGHNHGNLVSRDQNINCSRCRAITAYTNLSDKVKGGA